MSNFVRVLLHSVNIVSFIFSLVFAIFGLYEDIMGPKDAEKLLKRIGFPLNYNQVLIVGFICYAILAISYILRVWLSGNL